MDDERRARLNRLRWHCRRALLELDLVFQRFWECRANEDLDPTTEATLVRLLAMEDHDLWALVSGKDRVSDPDTMALVERLRADGRAPRAK